VKRADKTNSAIRGACPTVTSPMQTGDGLLARLTPHSPITIDKFVDICAASQTHGNGVIEITQRGSLQIRGLSQSSAPAFAQVIASLEIGVDEGPQLITSPLLGLDQEQLIDPGALRNLIATLRSALSRKHKFASLSPKVAVLIDGGGCLHLDAMSADIRLRATSHSDFDLALGGDARTAVNAGSVEPRNVVPVVEELLARVAALGNSARGKDLVAMYSGSALRESLDRSLDGSVSGAIGKSPGSSFGGLNGQSPPAPRSAAEPIGIHPLANGRTACGFALAFGHTTSAALQRFARVAGDLGATSIRPAPGRALLVIGLSNGAADNLRAAAVAEGFVVEPDDPRRYVVACPGAPACASATLPTRQLAPGVAHAARSFVSSSSIVHLSGCEKGCAHPGPAALTIVGPDRLIVNGRAGDESNLTVSAAGIVRDVERLAGELRGG
jgi:precorrin-3B synthase